MKRGLALMVLTVALAACSRESDIPEQVEQNDTTGEVTLNENVLPPPEPVMAQEQPIVNQPEPTIQDVVDLEQQTLEDADATGMTARMPASEDEQPAANQSEAQR